jgi:ceramide glucosyltransferase
MAFRAESLKAIGGFESIRDYLADDYQLGARIGNVALADVIVETSLGAGSWTDVWKHQVRWSRTIRISRPGGYFGYVVTQLTFWCLVAAIAGQHQAAIAGLAIRLLTAAFYTSSASLIFVPFRDLFGMAVWTAGMGGNTVEWRGTKFRLTPDGRMTRS